MEPGAGNLADTQEGKGMKRHTIVAQFDDYGAAHRALCGLVRSGILSNDISIVAGDRSNRHGAPRDFGILDAAAEFYRAAVRRGTTLLAAHAWETEFARVVEIIGHHAPADIAEQAADLAR
jgi:hypothetical protein